MTSGIYKLKQYKSDFYSFYYKNLLIVTNNMKEY